MGHQLLAPHLVPLYDWLETHLGFVPFFAGPSSATGRTILTARHRARGDDPADHHRHLAARSSCRRRALHEEAALALGATRWEMIRMAVLPLRPLRHGQRRRCSGSAAPSARRWPSPWCSRRPAIVTFNLISRPTRSTIAANIALNFKEATGLEVNTLIASGLALFVITFIVNFAARAIVNRRKEFSGAN